MGSADKSRRAGEPSPKEHFHLFLTVLHLLSEKSHNFTVLQYGLSPNTIFHHGSQIQWYQKILSLKMANFHKFLHGKGNEKPA